MKKEETISRDEAENICIKMAADIRQGVLNEIKVLHEKLFTESPTDNELYMIWTMASSSLDYIRQHLDDTLDDIKAGRYLPEKVQVAT